MVGAIAHLRGYDLNEPQSQAMLMLVVAGASPQTVAAEVGAKIGIGLAKSAVEKIPMTVIRQINKKVGFYLVAKYGTKRAAITLAKLIPIAGGIVGGAVDATLTQFVGSTAKKVFPSPGGAGVASQG